MRQRTESECKRVCLRYQRFGYLCKRHTDPRVKAPSRCTDGLPPFHLPVTGGRGKHAV